MFVLIFLLFVGVHPRERFVAFQRVMTLEPFVFTCTMLLLKLQRFLLLKAKFEVHVIINVQNLIVADRYSIRKVAFSQRILRT